LSVKRKVFLEHFMKAYKDVEVYL